MCCRAGEASQHITVEETPVYNNSHLLDGIWWTNVTENVHNIMFTQESKQHTLCTMMSYSRWSDILTAVFHIENFCEALLSLFCKINAAFASNGISSFSRSGNSCHSLFWFLWNNPFFCIARLDLFLQTQFSALHVPIMNDSVNLYCHYTANVQWNVLWLISCHG